MKRSKDGDPITSDHEFMSTYLPNEAAREQAAHGIAADSSGSAGLITERVSAELQRLMKPKVKKKK